MEINLLATIIVIGIWWLALSFLIGYAAGINYARKNQEKIK